MNYLDKLFGLKGKTAAVVGGGGYLCSAMAEALAKAGAKVVLLDKNSESMRKISKRITAKGGRSIDIPVDVTDKNSYVKALRAILKEYNAVDILINGAGINAPTSFFEISTEEWNSILSVHLTGTYLACQVFGEYMVKRRKGSIINMSSASAGPALSKAFTYSVAKAGIWNLTQNLAREWAPYNVRVNALRPGFFPTEWSMKHFIDNKRESAILGHTPMGRYGKPQELVGAVLWLSSDAASFVTGAHITVDGGFTSMTI